VFFSIAIIRAIVGMATTTAGNFGMAVGVALLRFSGDTTRTDSFHLTFNAFLGGTLMLVPVALLLRVAVKAGEKEEVGRKAGAVEREEEAVGLLQQDLDEAP